MTRTSHGLSLVEEYLTSQPIIIIPAPIRLTSIPARIIRNIRHVIVRLPEVMQHDADAWEHAS
ncbi:hypothetical protein GbCGDNIH3_7077 [Granulibacter bethesdensis]|uniref:Uncharacterized protein n=1 Tax=Granulibacter bethesdensis TaxID=364410 RepID=A0AAN0VG79_9PROT|nr:hypothetical protein [Granulibacter bethesdensis]AHJ63231.1 hypothetical protein GbCGDNIH3_7077 [Granulibacter bethesdensis]